MTVVHHKLNRQRKKYHKFINKKRMGEKLRRNSEYPQEQYQICVEVYWKHLYMYFQEYP